jgi:hypothetical protein
MAWTDYINMSLVTQGLFNGYERKDPQALKRYVDWGYEFVQHTPRKHIYQNMIMAIQTLEANNVAVDQQLKRDINADAIRLYSKFFKIKN